MHSFLSISQLKIALLIIFPFIMLYCSFMFKQFYFRWIVPYQTGRKYQAFKLFTFGREQVPNIYFPYHGLYNVFAFIFYFKSIIKYGKLPFFQVEKCITELCRSHRKVRKVQCRRKILNARYHSNDFIDNFSWGRNDNTKFAAIESKQYL